MNLWRGMGHSATSINVTVPDSDAYLAIGLHNQFIYIDPENNTVIAKLSYTPGPLGWEAENIAFFRKVSAMVAK